MCGIVAYVGPRDACAVVLDGLRRLEYRGYDSAGVAIHSGGGIDRHRCVGKLENLRSALGAKPLSGHLGMGHTRWATHGGVTRPTHTPTLTKRE